MKSRLSTMASFAETMIERFAESKLEDAYIEFFNKFQYDPRTAHDERIEFSDYGWSDDVLQLEYAEQTLHDCPYYVQLTFKLEDLHLTSTL